MCSAEPGPFEGHEMFSRWVVTGADDLVRTLRSGGFAVAEVDGELVEDDSSGLQVVSQSLLDAVPTLSGASSGPVKDWNLFMEDLEELQQGPERVAFVVRSPHQFQSAAPKAFQSFVECAGYEAGRLRERLAWGAPPENFPDERLIAVDLRIYLVSPTG